MTAAQRRAEREAQAGTAGTRGPGEPAPVALDLLRDYLAAQATVFLAELSRLRQGRRESSHRVRVACRRARSLLRTYRPLLEHDWADDLAGRLAEFTAAIAPERDAVVVRDRLIHALDALPDDSGGIVRARSLVERLLHRDFAAAHEETLAAVSGPRFHALADRLALAPESLPGLPASRRPAAESLFPLAAHSFEVLERRVAGLPDPLGRSAQSSLDDQAADRLWHRVRIAAKHARYAAEVCVPVAGPPAARFAERMAGLTTELGDQQDAAVAGRVLLRAARVPRISAPTGFVLGRLLGDARAGIVRGRAAFPALWAEASDLRYREWLGQP